MPCTVLVGAVLLAAKKLLAGPCDVMSCHLLSKPSLCCLGVVVLDACHRVSIALACKPCRYPDLPVQGCARL
jgi:hypothetical protein